MKHLYGIYAFFAIFACWTAVAIISGCGGGSGGFNGLYYGSVDGYVYAPVGGAARSADAMAGYLPLEGATVTVDIVSTTSNSSGYYSLTGISTGSGKTVTITKTGYTTATVTVTVTAGETATATGENTTEGLLTPTDSGSISVSSTPSNALIYLDSYPLVSSPPIRCRASPPALTG